MIKRSKTIDWKSYSTQYDFLARNNPSYRENIELLRALLPKWNLPSTASVCDLGAGTGNYICSIAKDIPEASFVHVDADPKMNAIARYKYDREGVNSVSVVTSAVAETKFPNNSFDLIMCVNALYAMESREVVLKKIHSWLKEDGIFFVIDFGRQTNLSDWGKYIFGNMYREEGIGACIRFVINGFETIRQNRKGSKGQALGNYWLHSTEEFGRTLFEHGFRVELLRTCYRGYCDLAVCRLNTPTPPPLPSP